MNYQDYIKTELLMLIPVLYFIGMGIKKSKMPDKWIPITLGITSVTLSAIWVVATSDISGIKETLSAIFTIFTQGILIAGASVYTNQVVVQSMKKE